MSKLERSLPKLSPSSKLAGPLEDSIALWERGEELAKICNQWLESAKERLDKGDK